MFIYLVSTFKYLEYTAEQNANQFPTILIRKKAKTSVLNVLFQRWEKMELPTAYF